MNPREWACFQCGSRFATDAHGELVEYALTTGQCRGCLRLLAILEASALWHRERVDPEPAPVWTRTQILARLRPVPAVPDYAKAAANDRDEE